MKKSILIFISLMFLTGCMEEREVSSLQDRGGVKYEINSEVGFTGKYVEKYENGQKSLEIHYKDGMKDGLDTSWYKNGQKWTEQNFKDGMYNGVKTFWWENGQKQLECFYNYGWKEGVSTFWWRNGQLGSVENYKNGRVVDGLSTEWNEEGQITKTRMYAGGEIIKTETYLDGKVVKGYVPLTNDEMIDFLQKELNKIDE
jgi:antitoxin component YwqK of YwqJK toxin-antitoxin module